MLKGKKSALAMMALDSAENIAALLLIDAVLLGKTGESPWFLIYAAAFYLKWMAVAAIRLMKDKWTRKAEIAEPELIAYRNLSKGAPACVSVGREDCSAGGAIAILLSVRRHMRTLTVWVMVGSAALLAQHVQDEDKKKRNPAIGNIAAIAAGEQAFNSGCAVCHGVGGMGGRGPNLSKGGVMWHTLTDEATFKRIKEGVPSGGMPPTPGSDEKLWELAAYVVALRAPASESPQTGDVALGQTLFWGKAGCNECHSIRGRGGKIGPDLSDAGGSRSTTVIRMAIEEPGSNGSKGFEKAHIVLKNGKTLDGVLKNRTNYSLQVLDARGELHLLLMSGVKEMAVAKKSAMPANYKARLSAAEINALVAYLARQTARPVEIAAK